MDPAGQRKQPRALMVNDDGSTSAACERRLQHEGYQVIRTADPVMALSLAQQSNPQIIFVNLGQRGSGSCVFLQALRSNDSTRHIPVAILSIYYDQSLERLGLISITIEGGAVRRASWRISPT